MKRQKAHRKPKKNPVANELPKYDWINVNGRMIKRPLVREENQVNEELAPPTRKIEKTSTKEKPQEIQSFRELVERSAQRSMVHDEFSVKSIVKKLVFASSILAAAYFFAKSIVEIMNK